MKPFEAKGVEVDLEQAAAESEQDRRAHRRLAGDVAELLAHDEAMRVPIAVRRFVDAGVEPIVVAKTLAIGDRDGGLLYRLSTRAGAFALAEHEASAVDWISLAIRDADPDLAADVMVSGATWLATQYGVDRELLVNLVTGTPRRPPARLRRRRPGRPSRCRRSGVDRHRDPAGAAAAVRPAGGCAVPGGGVTAAAPERWAVIDRLVQGVVPIPWSTAETSPELCDDWAEVLVQAAAFAHVRGSPGCRGYTTWSSGRAGCGSCGWGMSARIGDVGTPGGARFTQAAIARVGQAIALAVGEVVQALFEAVLP